MKVASTSTWSAARSRGLRAERVNWPISWRCRLSANLPPVCRCGHVRSVHATRFASSDGPEGCYSLEQMPKGKKPNWQGRDCDCAGYRAAWPNRDGPGDCVVCGIRFTWQGRPRDYCPKCERSCPYCGAYARGSTHCRDCGKHRGLSVEEFAAEAPPLSHQQRAAIAQLFSTGTQQYVPAPARCVECAQPAPHPRPGLCNECFTNLHGFARSE